jgi:hypothetical protein
LPLSLQFMGEEFSRSWKTTASSPETDSPPWQAMMCDVHHITQI